MLQKDADSSKLSSVVLLLQDMLEVVTRDMMVNEIRLVNFSNINFGVKYLICYLDNPNA